MSRDPLWHRLVDDAAVFPPGEASWPEALTSHRSYRSAAYGDMVGPLLVPAARTDDFLAACGARERGCDPLWIGLVGPLDALSSSLEQLAEQAPQVGVAAVELPLVASGDVSAVAARALGLGVPAVWLEVPWGSDGYRAVEDLAGEATPADVRLGAKLRTGGTTPDAVVPVDDLAGFLRATTSARLPFKLTAGLHHAVRGADPVTGGTTHGVLNVLVALDAVIAGADDPTVCALLSSTDGERAVETVEAWPAQRRRRLRESWASFGCCGVTDPLRELAALGVLDATGLLTAERGRSS